MKRMQKALSFSNIVAVLALFLALGGSVYAASNKINGRKIKPRSIPANRIKARSLTGAQIKARTLTGAKVKPGSLTGKQVVGRRLPGSRAPSPAGGQSAVPTKPRPGGAPRGTSTTAACPPGLRVIGGGAVVSNDLHAYVNDSGPQASRTGWEATARAETDGVTMTVTAICTSVRSTTPGLERQEKDYSPAPVYFSGG